jgi:hypothetical protein
LKEFLKLGPSADESLDLSCIFDDACPSPLRPHRDVLLKKQSSWKQFLAERSEYSELSLDVSALDISGDVSQMHDAQASSLSLSAAAARPPARGRLDRRALKSQPAEFKCRLSDLVVWRVLRPIPAQQLSATEDLEQLLQRVLRVHEARGSASVTVRVSLMHGVQREPLVVEVPVRAEDCAPLLQRLRPLFNGVGNESQDDERREALEACCGSCVSDALHLLCFNHLLLGAEIAVRHVRGEFAEQRVAMDWTPPAAAGEGGGEAAPLPSATTETALEKWNARLIALFHRHGVRKVDGGVELPEAQWQPSDLQEFAYPNGDYYRLHWQQVLQKDAFFRTKWPAGMEPADAD